MSAKLDDMPSRVGLAIAILLMGAAAGLVTLHVLAYTQISPIDELQHIDYLDKASRGHIVARGERVGEVAMREEACRGIDALAPIPRCDAAILRPSEFQEAGYNTAYIHPPTYYGVSGLIARVGEAMPGLDDLVTAARLTGGLWLAAAVALLWVAMADLGVGRLARASLLIVVSCSPTVLHASATVNPDAMALPIGAAMLLSTLRWEARRWSPWVPVAVAGIAILVKSTNVVAVGAAILYVMARHGQAWWSARLASQPVSDQSPSLDLEPSSQRTASGADVVRGIGGLVGAVVLASVAWVAVQGTIAEAPARDIPMVQRFEVESISLRDIGEQVGAAVSPLRDPYVPAVLHTRPVLSAIAVVNVAVLAGMVIAVAYGRPGSRRPPLAIASLIAMIAAGPLFVIINFVFVGTFVEIPSRYGLSVIPFALAAVTVVLERRLLLFGTAAYASWIALITIVPLI